MECEMYTRISTRISRRNVFFFEKTFTSSVDDSCKAPIAKRAYPPRVANKIAERVIYDYGISA